VLNPSTRGVQAQVVQVQVVQVVQVVQAQVELERQPAGSVPPLV
jgi:hypothetical protein